MMRFSSACFIPTPLRPPMRLASVIAATGSTSSPLIATARPRTKRTVAFSGLPGACIGHTPIVGVTMVIGVSTLSRSSASCERPARLPSVEYFFSFLPAGAGMPRLTR